MVGWQLVAPLLDVAVGKGRSGHGRSTPWRCRAGTRGDRGPASTGGLMAPGPRDAKDQEVRVDSRGPRPDQGRRTLGWRARLPIAAGRPSENTRRAEKTACRCAGSGWPTARRINQALGAVRADARQHKGGAYAVAGTGSGHGEQTVQADAGAARAGPRQFGEAGPNWVPAQRGHERGRGATRAEGECQQERQGAEPGRFENRCPASAAAARSRARTRSETSVTTVGRGGRTAR